ncbi:hypothetical protein V8E55_009289 [Tylopilus felleus]
MGHTHSRFSDRGRIDATSSPPSISHISLKVHKLHPSLTKSLPSSDEKDHSHYDSDLRPRPYIHSAAISFPVVSTPSPRRLPRRAGETYVNYMGGAEYPNALSAPTAFFPLKTSWVSSKLSSACADEAREMVLSFLQAPKGYTIFAANATGALKLVGEAFPFQKHSSFVLGTDSHNSVNGIRRFAAERDASVHHIPSTRTGGFKPSVATKLPGFYVEHLDLPTLVSTPDDLGSIMGHSEITVVLELHRCPFLPPIFQLPDFHKSIVAAGDKSPGREIRKAGERFLSAKITICG